MISDVQRPATFMDWNKVKHFTPAEFYNRYDGDTSKPKESMLPWLDERAVSAIDALREQLGAELIVSSALGSIARDYEKGSQHYCVNRLSTAVDLLVPHSTLKEVYSAALKVPEIGGIGLYPDWRPEHGVHIDVRPRKQSGAPHTWMAVGHPQIYSGINWARIG